MSFHRAFVKKLLALEIFCVAAAFASCPPSYAQASHSESHQRVGWIPWHFLSAPSRYKPVSDRFTNKFQHLQKKPKSFTTRGLIILNLISGLRPLAPFTKRCVTTPS